MNNFKEEAERKYPDSKYEQIRMERFRKRFIEAAEFGYQLGIEEGLRFAEWLSSNAYDLHPDHKCWIPLNGYSGIKYTTSELFEIFKKEQDGNK
jgi:hypothetical protein